MADTFDAIVIGLGAMGSATTYQLAKRGRKVLGIDRYSPPHGMGSSHGETRITRLACGEGAQYTAFARRSHEIWRELEARTGEQLLVQNGLLVISGPGERASAHGNAAFLDTTIVAARQNQVAHELLSDSAIRQRFPAFNVADGDRGYFEPEAGFVFPERCIAVQLALARQSGAAVHTGETVQRFAPAGDRVDIVTDHGSYSAAKIVIAAGPWIPELVPQRAALFTVRRQVLTWFAIDGQAERHRPQTFPVFYWQVPRRQAIYGFPWIGGGEPSLKLAAEQYDTATTPGTVDRTASHDEIAALHTHYVADFFPGVSARCVKSEVCLYTCVDDARFIVDALPDNPRVIVASPCSGHGFKHSAAIGEAIADLIVTGTTGRVSLDGFKFRS